MSEENKVSSQYLLREEQEYFEKFGEINDICWYWSDKEHFTKGVGPEEDRHSPLYSKCPSGFKVNCWLMAHLEVLRVLSKHRPE